MSLLLDITPEAAEAAGLHPLTKEMHGVIDAAAIHGIVADWTCAPVDLAGLGIPRPEREAMPHVHRRRLTNERRAALVRCDALHWALWTEAGAAPGRVRDVRSTAAAPRVHSRKPGPQGKAGNAGKGLTR